MKLINRVVVLLLQSPFRRLLPRSIDAIRYVGQRSRRTITTPTQFVRNGDRIIIVPGHASKKKWWRNFRAEQELEVLIDGRWSLMYGTALIGAEDPERVGELLSIYLEGLPKAARAFPEDPIERVESAVVVECRPQRRSS